MSESIGIGPRKAARTAGVLYLIIIVSGIAAEFFIRQNLVVSGEAAATAANLRAHGGLFRLSIAGDLIMIASDTALALFFYILLKPVSNALSLLSAFFRLAQAAVLSINLLNLFFALQLAGRDSLLDGFSPAQSESLVLLFLDGHRTGYTIGLVLFGFSLFVLGLLVWKADFFPGILGILLIVAAFGYLIDCFSQFLLPHYDDYEHIFSLVVFLPAFIGELSMCAWLLIKGVREPASLGKEVGP